MESELHKLRIEKEHKSTRVAKARWPKFAIVAAILFLIVLVWQVRASTSMPRVQTMQVRIPKGVITENDLQLLNATGYVIAAHKIELATKVVGRVAWVGVEMGDRIAKGQTLVRLEDDEYRARVAQEQGQLDNAKAKLAELQAGSRPQEIASAQAEVDKAEASLQIATINYKRLADLLTTHSVSQQQVDDAESLMRTRKAEEDSEKQQLDLAKVGPRKEVIDAQAATVRELEGSLALAQVDLDNTVIKSSITGTVLERNVEVGEFVTTGFVGDRGAKGYVLSIADLNDLRVDLDVSQNDFAKVSLHQPCWIVTDAYPDRRYDGEVDLISPEANRQKATIEVRVKVTSPDDYLKPDMNATVSFLSASKLATTQETAEMPVEQRPMLKIPTTSIRDGAIFVVEEGKAIKRPVQLGVTSAGEIEVKKGLIGGELLITDPPTSLNDGDMVKVSS